MDASSRAWPGLIAGGGLVVAGEECTEEGASVLVEDMEEVHEEDEVWREYRIPAGAGVGVAGGEVIASVTAVEVPGDAGLGQWVLPSAKSQSAARYSGRGSSGTVSWPSSTQLSCGNRMPDSWISCSSWAFSTFCKRGIGKCYESREETARKREGRDKRREKDILR